MTLQQFRDVLKITGIPVSHYVSDGNKDRIVWAEYDGKRLNGDDGPDVRVALVQVDFYTKTPYHPALESLLEALEKHEDIAHEEPLTTYEQDTGYIHHIINCEVILDGETDG